MIEKSVKFWGRLFMPKLMTAIKNRTKTQTRRPLTWKNTWFDGGQWPKWARKFSIWDWENATVKDGVLWIVTKEEIVSPGGNWGHRITPRVKVGDIFWTKETHAYSTIVSSTAPGIECGDRRVIYRAECDETMDKIITGCWRPSIFQKKEHSRFHLPITNVRLEQVQSISEEDAIAEGVWPSIVGADLDHLKYRAGFQTVWEGLYGGGPGKWEDNYWVIAYNFDIEEVNHETD